MAINITEGCMDDIESTQTCKLPSIDNLVSRNTSNDQAIPFHRHCQGTVCSAYGYEGAGLTWNTLYQGDDDLANIQRFVSQNSSAIKTWYGYFTRNETNITEDLRSILELINIIAGQTATKSQWNLIFKDDADLPIAHKVINPWNGGSQDYIFKVGRTINLSINGDYAFSFHTMKKMDSENLLITLPQNDLNISFNGKPVGEINGIFMPDRENVNIQQDYNTINMGSVSHQYTKSTLTLDPNQHAYRVYMYSQTNAPLLKVDLSNYYSESQTFAHGKPDEIVEFELHMINNQEGVSRTLIAPPPGKQPSDFEDYVTPSSVWRRTNWNGSLFSKDDMGIEINALTDELTVAAHTANVYIVRLDLQRWIVTYSLAYTYPFTT